MLIQPRSLNIRGRALAGAIGKHRHRDPDQLIAPEDREPSLATVLCMDREEFFAGLAAEVAKVSPPTPSYVTTDASFPGSPAALGIRSPMFGSSARTRA